MKVEEREEVTKYAVFIAEDGTEFTCKESCEQYDSSARCVIRARLNIKVTNEWELCHGCEDNLIEICDGKPDDLLMYAALLKNITHYKGCFDEFIAKGKPKKQSKLIVFMNCDEMPYDIMWADDFYKNIDNIIKGEEVK